MDVVVVGSCMYDMFTYVSRFPKPGETIEGKLFETGFGGKGANQAVCGAILGAKVGMVGKVGDDNFGRDTIENFKRHGVDIAQLQVASGTANGIACITVEDAGENHIVFIPGANYKMEPQDVKRASNLISNAKVVVCQNEITLSATIEALSIAKAANVTTLFNPSPMMDFPESLFRLIDIWCLNQTEIELLMKFKSSTLFDTPKNIKSACKPLLDKSKCRAVILTLGAQGAAVVTEDDIAMIPAAKIPKEQVVDTTGAGDSFLGTVAVCLAYGNNLIDAVKKACEVSGETVKFRGCQASYLNLKPL